MKYIAIHHTAVSAVSNQLAAVDRYHKGKWGMRSSLGWYVGYNFFCDVDGKITNTRAVGEETIAQVGHNCDVPSRCDTISFCFAGDFNTHLPNEKQLTAFQEWRKDYTDLQVIGHRDLQKSRTCPGALMTREYMRTTLMGQVPQPDPDDAEKAKIAQLQHIYDQLYIIWVKLSTLLQRPSS